MQFEFATATRIIFGEGTLPQVGKLARELGTHALVVTGGNPDRAARLFDILREADVETTAFPVAGEPTIELARDGVTRIQENRCNLVISFGGGSALDAGKALAALATNAGDPLDYLEVIGAGKALANAPLPFIAIPTTAGTGAEVTRNAVLASPEHRVKVSLRSAQMLPKLALVDPELTYSLPPDVTAATGLDALTQNLEPFVSHLANPMTDALAREGLYRAARSLRQVFRDGSDRAARHDMALASLMGGLALANAKLGAVHGFAGVIGGMFPAPHGAVCARLLPFVMTANLHALSEREPENPAAARYDEVARILTGEANATAADGVLWVNDVAQELNVAAFSTYGLTAADIPTIVEKSSVSSSMKGNPLKLTPDELSAILQQAL